jgi:hypothetical protein
MKYTDSLKDIRSLHGDDDPVIAVDVSCLLVEGVKSKAAVEQLNAGPKSPATAVTNYVLNKVDQMKKERFVPVLNYDGQFNPLKAEENARRQNPE